MTRTIRLAAVTAAALALTGCTGGAPGADRPQVDLDVSNLRLVAFDSCEQALTGLREAISSRVGPYGLDGVGVALDRAVPAAPPGAAAGAERAESAPDLDQSSAQGGDFSTTNVHEQGVDEPDLVKTDGRRIVSVAGGTLRVVDAASREVTGTLRIADELQPMTAGEADLLLAGDRALVIPSQQYWIADRGGRAMPDTAQPLPDMPPLLPDEFTGPELILVDLSGAPKELARFTVDGRYVDARMVGDTVRVVTASAPRLNFVHPKGPDDEPNALRANREIVANSTIEDWLPRYRTSTASGVSEGRVDCSALTHPAKYSATSMLTVLTFDLTADRLGTGDPVTIVADGETVYGTATSLYVANNQFGDTPMSSTTELYKFDTSRPGRPGHVGSGVVPGRLLNQYSMSEYEGMQRVATTTGDGAQNSESAVYVLEHRGDKLPIVGQVGGLGRTEQIHAVRFVGPVGYVVTFRRTDPLYTIDLRRPSSPKVVGELKIPGYSAYLHPAGDGRIIGVGQDATDEGRVTGTQVSLFDVSDPAKPARIAQYQVPGGYSEAEGDPHAFLYWEPTRTVVLPTTVDRTSGQVGALVLRLGDASFELAGEIRHLESPTTYGVGAVRRSLVIGDQLWTLSAAGLAAHDLGSVGSRGWIAFQ